DFGAKAGKAVETTLKFGIDTGKKLFSSLKKQEKPEVKPFQTSFPTMQQPVATANGYIIPQPEIIPIGPGQAASYIEE
ncbi:1237_t:CDS:1, partial [Ambispora leptoticha]